MISKCRVRYIPIVYEVHTIGHIEGIICSIKSENIVIGYISIDSDVDIRSGLLSPESTRTKQYPLMHTRMIFEYF